MTAPERTALLGVGPFGLRVASLLAGTLGGRELPPGAGVEEAFEGSPGAVVLALWRPAPALCEEADALSHRLGVPWLPVVLEPSSVQIGPLVVPGRGPCHRCFDERRLQHDPRWRDTLALFDAYDRDRGCGPAGYLPQHARAAAGLAASVLLGPADAGGVVTFHPREMSVGRDRVLGCHGCPRCGGPIPRRDLRALLAVHAPAPADAPAAREEDARVR
ncbi:TOMM precursor leader peptide-binding protein [Streptomyces sp. NPDC050560]|uniref:TOMM precursor leader peptide-binding protein n=1 Tax=Streptomyces sp. NPDC050560 TaxID=3365630 RepID=UPI0037AB92C2